MKSMQSARRNEADTIEYGWPMAVANTCETTNQFSSTVLFLKIYGALKTSERCISQLSVTVTRT